jgi:hypothetical protein
MLVGDEERIYKITRSDLLKIRQAEFAKTLFKHGQGVRIGEVPSAIARGTF